MIRDGLLICDIELKFYVEYRFTKKIITKDQISHGYKIILKAKYLIRNHFFTDILSINALVRTIIDNDQELKHLSHINYRYFIWW